MKANGVKVQALDTRPTLLPELVWFYETFEEISSDRRITSEGLPLPLTTNELSSFYYNYGIYDSWTFDQFASTVRLIDVVWLEASIKAIASKRKVEQAEAKRRKR